MWVGLWIYIRPGCPCNALAAASKVWTQSGWTDAARCFETWLNTPHVYRGACGRLRLDSVTTELPIQFSYIRRFHTQRVNGFAGDSLTTPISRRGVSTQVVNTFAADVIVTLAVSATRISPDINPLARLGAADRPPPILSGGPPYLTHVRCRTVWFMTARPAVGSA